MNDEGVSLEARAALKQRLNHVEEVCWLMDSLMLERGLDLEWSADGLELDLYACLMASMVPEKDGLSAWLIHSSWKHAAHSAELISLLPANVVSVLSSPAPLGFFLLDGADWLQLHKIAVRDLLDFMYSADEFSKCYAALVSIDVCLIRVLGYLISTRLCAQPS
jgi:hypothetical protein